MIRLSTMMFALAVLLAGVALAETPPAGKTPAAGTTATPPGAPAPGATGGIPPQPGAAPAAKPSSTCAGNPDAIGLARTVEIDTTGGPGFGFEQYKAYDFLQPGEVVFTFDDGPWPENTRSVLATLAANCTKATFFPVGKHAIWHPEILKEVAAAGHTVGSHTWSHANLSKLKQPDAWRVEIEKGISAVKIALGAPGAPFFRFPYLQDPPDAVAHLGQRNIALFSMDVDAFDFKFHKPEQIIKSVMTKIEKKGKGIILMHDFQEGTAKALPELLKQLKAKGFKVVHMRAKAPVTSLATYDEEIAKETAGVNVGGGKPMSSVVKTVGDQ